MRLLSAWARGQILPTKHFHHEIARAEHAVNHAWTYLRHARVLDKPSLCESRLNRIVAKNLDLLLCFQADRRERERDAPRHPARSNDALPKPPRPPQPQPGPPKSRKFPWQPDNRNVTPQLRQNIREMLAIAIPLACAELGWMLMSVVDSIMVGHLPHSAAAIGAASLGSASFYIFAIFGIGLMSGLDTFASHAFGANDLPEARRALAAALTLAILATPILAAVILGITPFLSLLGIAPEIRTDAIAFSRILLVSLPLLLLFTCLRRYLQGLHHVRPITFAAITSNLVNLAGNWLLIYGHWGFPALGVRGSALSTVIARLYLAGFLLCAVHRRDPAALHNLKPHLPLVIKLFRLGLPAALTIGFEVGIFNLVTALVATLDPVSLAAHTIALNAASVTYMVPLGISSAAAVSVGRALGAGDRPGAARAGWTALGLASVFEVASAIGFVLLPRQIAGIYTQDQRVISLSVSLFAVAALFQLFDGLQTVATGALRGVGNTRTAMAWNLFCYWVLALPLGCFLGLGHAGVSGFELHWGAIGFWDALCLALILIATGLTAKWYFLTKFWKDT